MSKEAHNKKTKEISKGKYIKPKVKVEKFIADLYLEW